MSGLLVDGSIEGERDRCDSTPQATDEDVTAKADESPVQADRPDLTERQRLVLDFVKLHISEHGYPPTLREIGREMNITSTNGVNDHLNALVRKGYLQREGATARSLRPVNPLRVTPQQVAARRAESALAELQETLAELEARVRIARRAIQRMGDYSKEVA